MINNTNAYKQKITSAYTYEKYALFGVSVVLIFESKSGFVVKHHTNSGSEMLIYI